MEKVDIRKVMKTLYCAPTEPVLVDVPRLTYAMIDGTGDPNGSEDFTAASEALFTLSFTLKFGLKKDGVIDWSIPGLEGLWWVDPPGSFDADRRKDWRWTLMVPQPAALTRERFEVGRREALARKGLAILESARLEDLEEGRSAQVLHRGPYAQETATVERLHRFIAAEGLSLRGKHHEIYLSDPRRCAPGKLKTLLRQPVS